MRTRPRIAAVALWLPRPLGIGQSAPAEDPAERHLETVRREHAPWRPSRLTARWLFPDRAALTSAWRMALLPGPLTEPLYRVEVLDPSAVFGTNGELARPRAGEDAAAADRRALLYWRARHGAVNQWLYAGPIAVLGVWPPFRSLPATPVREGLLLRA